MQIKLKYQQVFKDIESLVSRKTNLPETSHILFEVRGGDLVVTATNQEVMLSAEIEADIKGGKEPYSFQIPGKAFISAINAGDLEIEPGEGFAILEIPTGRYRVPTLPGSNFSAFYDNSKAKRIGEVDFSEFKKSIKKALYAIGEEWPDFSGLGYVLIESVSDLNEVRVVTSDGYRFAIGSLKSSGLTDSRALISKKEAKFLAFSGIEKATVYKTEGCLVFKGDNKEYIVRVVEGAFPDYEGVLVEKYSGKSIYVDRESFLEALIRLRNITLAERVALRFSSEKISIYTPNEDGKEEVPSKGEYTGEIFFNPYLLIEALRHIKNDVKITALGSEAPLFIDSEGYTAMVMPMRK